MYNKTSIRYELIPSEEVSTQDNNNNNNNNNLPAPTYNNIKTSNQFTLRRMACFGSPKFDRREPLHILSADSRFPDVEPRRIRKVGNHFLALFPVNTLKHVADGQHHHHNQLQQQRFRRHALIRGGSRIEGNKNREKVVSSRSGDDNDGKSTRSGNNNNNKRNNNGSWTSKVMDWFVIEDNDHGMSFDSDQHNMRDGIKARALLLQLLGDLYWGILGGCL